MTDDRCKMKILVVSDSYTYQTNGVANVVISQVNELRKRGYCVKVLALSNDDTSYKRGDDYYIASYPSKFYPDIRLSKIRRHPLLDELKAWKPDVIHMHTEGSVAMMARTIARGNKIPFVMTSHTDYAQFAFGELRGMPPLRLFAREMGRVYYRGAKKVITPSEKAVQFSQLSAVKRRVVVIPNGIRLELYGKTVTPEERRELFRKYHLRDNGKTLVVVSRVSKEKNIQELLDYLPGLLSLDPQVQLLIVGDGPDRERLEKLAKKRHLTKHVRFTGRVDPEIVYRYYAMGDLFVSASTFEVHSLTYLEAMAQGLPLVCRKDLCLEGVLDQGVNGYAYQTREQFIRAVFKILNNESLRKKMKKKARARASEFSEERFVDNTLELYEKLIRE